MKRELLLTPVAREALERLASDPHSVGLLKQVRKTLGFLETNLRHPSLCTHKFQSLVGPNGEEIFEAYIQNQAPGAFRVFFYYGPDRVMGERRIPALTILAITPHP